MPEPKNREEYLHRFNANQKIEGYGLEVAMSVPCPFCAAPAFIRYKVLDVEKAMQQDTKCGECGRSAKAIFQKSPGGTQFEIVQTGGPDQPDWFTPKMRRVS